MTPRVRAATALVALGLAALAGACATARGPKPVPGGLPFPACLDVDYRGGFTSSTRKSQHFRMAARLCPGGRALLEFRGLVGGAALVAGVAPAESVRLVFPSRHVVVDGPDETWFWEKWTGAPLDGRLVREMTEAAGGKSVAVQGWSIQVGPIPPHERLPGTFAAESGRGDRIELTKVRERPAAGALEWPSVPPGFEKREDRSGPAPDGTEEEPSHV